MNATGKRRLLKLADFLETAEIKGEFNMNTWGRKKTKDGQVSCGSEACAAGWATTIPAFHRAGLRLVKAPAASFHNNVPAFGRKREAPALGAFFSMNLQQVSRIFGNGTYPNTHGKKARKDVARRIRKLVASSTTRAA